RTSGWTGVGALIAAVVLAWSIVALAAARETVELSGETVEYDVERRVSVVTGGPGTPATLVSGKLNLSGARLEYNATTGQVKAEGGVRLEQTEPDRVVATARTLTADVKARTAVLQGDVRIVSGKAVATAAQARFDSKGRQVTLSGSPEVRLEENVLRAKEVVFFLAEQKVRASGGSQAQVLLPEKEE
ncbi:MAG TPA: hypothetical protein GXX28_00135, partial [Firmicutes bacterium]|nr:hypothetical protein [Bacillota bacterium]